jgi:hypothetical protein
MATIPYTPMVSVRTNVSVPFSAIEVRVKNDCNTALAALRRLQAIEGQPLWIGDPHFDVIVRDKGDGRSFDLRSKPRRFRTLYLPRGTGVCVPDDGGGCIVKLDLTVAPYEAFAPILLMILGVFLQSPETTTTSRGISAAIAVGMHVVAMYAVFRPACRRIGSAIGMAMIGDTEPKPA